MRNLRITWLPSFAFDTTYNIEVAVIFNGVIQPYTPANCTVRTPAPVTQLANCGQTISSLKDIIYANIVRFATGYQFKVTNTADASDTHTINRQLREFRMSLLTNIQYDATYDVQVAVRNTDGTYLPYGPICTVTTPTFPTTEIQASQCGLPVASNTTYIYANIFSGAEAYRFLLENNTLSYSQSVDRVLRVFNLNSFTGLTPGETYTVRVALKINCIYGPYGNPCQLTVPGTAPVAQSGGGELSFKMKAYPNPFVSSFRLGIENPGVEPIGIKIYDMTGRLVDDREIKADEINQAEFGRNCPTGVFNVIITQGQNVKSYRIIKR